jgi:DNA-binding LacI/PurR family transcriptional regulator
MATISDVAKRAGVCKATISRVINKTGQVSDTTRKVVMAAIKELEYNPSVIAQGMRSRITKTIAVVMPDYGNPFLPYIYKKIETSLKKYDYMALICQTSGDFEEEVEYINRLLRRQIDGIILFTHNDDKEQAVYFNNLAKKLPLVLFDEGNDKLYVSQISTNGYKGIKEAMQHLIDRGHKRIGCLVTAKGTAKRRLQGYIDVLMENGIEFDPKLVYYSSFQVQESILAAKYYAYLENRPTAVVAFADYLAIGIMKYFGDIGINVPNDMEVIGFDGIDLTKIITPELTTIAQPIEVLASEMISILMEKINNTEKIGEVKKIVIDGELIIRNSTKQTAI